MLKQVEPTVDSPDRLLELLELELASKRQRRMATGAQRASVVAAGLLIVLTAAAGALFFLFTMLSDMTHRGDESPGAVHTASAETHR